MTNPGEGDLEDHYRQEGLADRILDRLSSAGLDVEHLTPAQLSGVDEFHLGGGAATAALLADLQLADDARVLDVGCGVGGPARHLAAASRRHVRGVDITSDFVALAIELSARTGFDSQTSFEVGNALELRFDDNTFDAATMFHVGMNIADKTALFTELARVVRPGGVVAVYDIMRVGDGELSFPVPWSASPATSHLAAPSEYLDAMRGAGLAPSDPIDRRSLVAEAMAATNAEPPPADLSHLMGANWPAMFANLRAALAGGVVAPTQILARCD